MPQCECPEPQDALLADRYDGRTYHTCEDFSYSGQRFLRCSDGQYFDQSLGYCLWDQ